MLKTLQEFFLNVILQICLVISTISLLSQVKLYFNVFVYYRMINSQGNVVGVERSRPRWKECISMKIEIYELNKLLVFNK